MEVCVSMIRDVTDIFKQDKKLEENAKFSSESGEKFIKNLNQEDENRKIFIKQDY